MRFPIPTLFWPAVTAAMFLFSCAGSGSSGTTPVAVTDLCLNTNTVIMAPGGTWSFQVLTGSGAPFDGVVSWSCSGGTFASTNANPNVYTAPATVGTYTVTATSVKDPGVKANARITVQGEVLFFTLPGGERLELVSIPAGTFLMGSEANEAERNPDEGPRHSVTLSRPFYMGKFEVTQAQWLAVMGSNPSHFPGDPRRPVEQMPWSAIAAAEIGFLDRLNALTASTRPSGLVFRLPTEAEWEYSCRAGTSTRFYWGDDLAYGLIGDYAWWGGNSGGCTHPVGQKRPNAWGLYDMSGNVWEWIEDWYAPYSSYNQVDPQGPFDGTNRIARGASWRFYGYGCRSAFRDPITTESGFISLGLRLVLAPPKHIPVRNLSACTWTRCHITSDDLNMIFPCPQCQNL